MDNYYYKLQYTNGNETVTHEFPADIGAEKLIYYLRDFLCGCSWSEDVVKDSILRFDDDTEEEN